MFSKPANPILRSAAWRISLWATLAFAIGTMLVFAMLHRFVANDIQRRSDAWLSGEVEVLSDVAERTPKNTLYSRVVGEIAELASREVPNRQRASTDGNEDDSVFFLQASDQGNAQLWVGSGDGAATLSAIRSTNALQDTPFDVQVKGIGVPFRVASVRIPDGSSIYLGLSERDELHVLHNLRIRFLTLWLAIVLLGFVIVFYATRRMLGHVREITEAASRIGQSDLSSRVPNTESNDEIGHLARTLNHMLDRIENSVHQLHTITDSLAHDLRSPLTAIRGKLETVLSDDMRVDHAEPIVSAIDELDRLTEFLNTSLDVAEANADALRLNRKEVDLDEVVRSMIDLYEPSMSDKGLAVHIRSAGAVRVLADPSLLHRVIANLLDNELKHLPASCTVSLSLQTANEMGVLTVEDNGPGFDEEIRHQLFERRIKGRTSRGHGLGLAFVEAVVRVHGGTVKAANRALGGAQLTLALPLCQAQNEESKHALALTNG
ncbi:signal transduction histidine kinase [Granulicella aggregans]|uniref:histidine kinase n=1 Tax=Granulicella aggregans TaxID=474949 RepID=A0A7W7ZGI4_9BACT|nr:ATP-binding protein [Granulicella aggregans]MBB5059427.1 signal transduction histidine kinase [Granulicella aggregans]